MKRNHFAPAAAINYLDELLKGSPDNQLGLESVLEQYEQIIATAQTQLADTTRSEEYRKFIKSGIGSTLFKESHQNLLDQVRRVKQLRDDLNMRTAYKSLMSVDMDERQLRGFLGAALRAGRDFTRDTDAEEIAKSKAKKIANTAKKLRALLIELKELTLLDHPEELFSIKHLLAMTDNTDSFLMNNELWAQRRKHLLGTELTNKKTPIPDYVGNDYFPLTEIAKEDFERVRKKLLAAVLDYSPENDDIQLAWSVAPEFPDILKSLAKTASGYSVVRSGMVGAALGSRKNKLQRPNYIRAFGYILSHEYNIEIVGPVLKAIAITTNVVLYDPNPDPSDISDTSESYVYHILEKVPGLLPKIRSK